jgi:DeoR/GlpR family transcriptional regulator of sugar metabolism
MEQRAMLSAERRQHILERLRAEGKVLASELSAQLSVSEDTIRRDLRELNEAGMLVRVHGGALPKSPASASYRARALQAPEAKAAIARAAVNLMRDGQVIILDGGTTAQLVAQHLPEQLRATIVTNSPPIAVALAEHAWVEVILLGGQLFKHSQVTVGAVTVAALAEIRADLCLLGVCSLHPDVGISIPDYEETQVKRQMIRSSAEVVALASPEKLGTAAPFMVAPLAELTHIVTERSVAEATLAPYRALGITVVQA